MAHSLQLNGGIYANGNSACDGGASGSSNALQEYLAGTDPNNATDVLKLKPAVVTGNTLKFEFATKPGKNYRIEARADLFGGAWQPSSTGVIANGGMTEFSLLPEASPKMFFRIVVIP